MFGLKKMYKKGLADAMQSYETFGRKQEAALEKIREEVRAGNKKLEDALASLGENIFAVFEHLECQEKNALYKIATPMDIKDLDESEKLLLIAVLHQLAADEGELYKQSPDQRVFLNSVYKRLDVTDAPMEADYSVIENISDLNVQKIFYRVALEFIYLQNSDEMSDAQMEFFTYFMVNRRQAAIIEFDVIRQFEQRGTEGMREKYGAVDLCDLEADEAEEAPTITKRQDDEEFHDKMRELARKFNESADDPNYERLLYLQFDVPKTLSVDDKVLEEEWRKTTGSTQPFNWHADIKYENQLACLEEIESILILARSGYREYGYQMICTSHSFFQAGYDFLALGAPRVIKLNDIRSVAMVEDDMFIRREVLDINGDPFYEYSVRNHNAGMLLVQAIQAMVDHYGKQTP